MRVILFAVLFILISSVIAQETHNLEILWMKTSPESVVTFGRCISSGDVNQDDYSDIMIVGDSIVDLINPDSAYRGICWIFWSGQYFDTISDVILKNPQKLIFWSLHANDINGDRFDDVILGACNNADGYGEVLIFLGSNTMDTVCDCKIKGPSRGSNYGCALSSGDVNGDNYNDLLVGAYTAAPRPGGSGMGQVFIYFGGPQFDTIPDVVLNGGHDNDYEGFGISISSSGNVNNDGFSDVIIGAMNFGYGRGRIYIYFGGNPMDTIYDVAMSGEELGQLLGQGNVIDFIKNYYFFDYAIISNHFWTSRNEDYYTGKIYVLFGDLEMDSVPDIWMIGRTSSSYLGISTRNAGDVNGDFSDDIISGAPMEFDRKGSTYLWLSGFILDTIPDAWIRGTQIYDEIGWNVATAGDVDGDNKNEIMVSNYSSDFTANRVWICKYTGPGIEEERQMQNTERLTLEINPNPARSVIRVRGPFSEKTIKIFDVSGKMIKEIEILRYAQNDGAGGTKISLKGINPGIYFLRLGKETKKFLVVK